MAMSKGDYAKIAAVLKTQWESALNHYNKTYCNCDCATVLAINDAFMDMLEKDNPRFDRALFRGATGIMEDY